METLTRPTCEERLWRAGAERSCARSVGTRTWTDETGRPHAGCPFHIAGLKHRFPEVSPLIERAMWGDR